MDPEAVLTGPLCVGDYAKIEAGAQLREYTVVGSNVIVKEGAFLHRAVVHNNVYVGRGVTLRGCVIGKNTDVMGQARIEEGAVVGDECVIEPDSYVSAGVKVYPFKTIEAGAVVNTSVIWESRGQRTLFGPRGVSGLVNVEITPELCVRLASAYATTLKKGAVVTTSRDASRAARALKRAVHGALNASAINVVDLEAQPMPLARFETARSDCSGGIALRTTPGDPQSIDIIFMDADGADLSQSAQRKLERVFSRQEYRRAFPGEIAELTYPPRVVEAYTARAAASRRHDRRARRRAEGGGRLRGRHHLAGAARPARQDRRRRADGQQPAGRVVADPVAGRRPGRTCTGWPSWSPRSRAAFGVRFDPVGERIALVDDKGALVSDDRALLVVLDLIAAERRSGRVALPVTTTRVAEEVCRFHGVEVDWTPTSLHGLYEAAAGRT